VSERPVFVPDLLAGKVALVSSLENSLTAIKASAEQSSFSLTGAGT